jgi:CheY-like chemotaxis protein
MKKVLVVDDDVDFAEMLAENLESHGYTVVAAHSGEDAVTLFREDSFDFCFLDVQLPGIDGVETLRLLKGINPSVRAAIMTGYAIEESLQKAGEIGVVRALNKPLDLAEVIRIVETVPKNAHVLIVDDDASFAETIKELLMHNEYRTTVAGDGDEGLRLVREGHVDLVILDMRLPTISGLEVCEQLADHDPPIPIIVVTAYSDERTRALAYAESAVIRGVLSKPFEPEILLIKVNETTANL